MLRSAILLCLCLLLQKSSFSQRGFIIDSVRYTCLTEQELDSVIVTYIDLDECSEISDTLKSQVRQLENYKRWQQVKIDILKQDSIAQQTVLFEYVGQIKASDEKVDKLLNRQQRTNFALYIVTALAAAFAITTFAK